MKPQQETDNGREKSSLYKTVPMKLVIGIMALCLASCNGQQEQGAGANKKPLARVGGRPNVIILLADDQGTLDAGCYGSTDIQTPNLDKLATQGILFTQGYGHTVCCPSRAALLTGRAPQRGGVNDWTSCNPVDTIGARLGLKEVTIAEHLKKFGYATALIGKWHLGAVPGYGPNAQGFDYFFGFRGGFIDYYTHYFLHSHWEKPPFHDLYRNNKEVFEPGKYFPDLQVAEAEKFVENNEDKPFFLYLAFNLPHYPEEPDSAFIDQYKNLPWPRRSYAPMVTTIDDRIGKFLAKLDELGLRENTVIIYASDNGHSTEDYYNWDVSYGANGGGGNTGRWRGAKGSFFEGGLRVPTVISYPKVFAKGEVRNQAITSMDFFPTICDILKIPLPENKLDGTSILPVLQNADATEPHPVLYWMWQDMWTVRKGKWKLIFKGHDTTGKYSSHPEKQFQMPEIYLANLEDQKPEEINHAKEHPEIVKELTALHEKWAEDIFKGSGIQNPDKAKVKRVHEVEGANSL